MKILNAPLAKPINLPIEHCIDLKNLYPVSSPPRKIPYSLEKLIKSEIRTLFENGVIEKSNSQYASPIVPIKEKRKDKNSCRLSLVEKENHP